MGKNGFLSILPLLLVIAALFIGCPNTSDSRIELTKSGDGLVSVAAAATTATAEFEGAKDGLALTTADFTVTAGATLETPVVLGSLVTIKVNFAANTAGTPKTFTVSINPDSSLIKGDDEVKITQGAADTRPLFTAPTAAASPAFTDASTIVTFTGTVAPPTGITSADFAVTTSPASTPLPTLTVASSGNNINVTVNHGMNTGAARTFNVIVASTSTRIRGTGTATIAQAADTRVTLPNPETTAYDGTAAAGTTTVSFQGATGLTLDNTDFVTNDAAVATIGIVSVSATGEVTVPVNYIANTAAAERVITVSINPTSTKIKGTASVTITQPDPNDYRAVLTAFARKVIVDNRETSGTATFVTTTAVSGLNIGDFTISSADATLDDVTISSDGLTVEVEVTFADNPTYNTLSYVVGINHNSEKIRGSATVEIIHAPIYMKYAFRKMEFESAALGTYSNTTYWTPRNGLQGTNTGGMDLTIVQNIGDVTGKMLNLTGGAHNNSRASQLNFVYPSNSVQGTSKVHKIAFDWYPGSSGNDVSYLGIQDDNKCTPSNSAGGVWDNQFIAFYIKSGKMSYKTGNNHIADSADVNNTAAVDAATEISAITDLSKWYNFSIILDFEEETIDLVITDNSTGVVIFGEILPFESDIVYKENIGSIRFLRAGSNSSQPVWSTYIDNLEVLRQAVAPTDGAIHIDINFITEQGITVTGWTGGNLSKADGTVSITVADFNTADWYLNGAADPFTGDEYELDVSALRVGNNFLTVVVSVDGVEYSKKLNFTVVQ